MNAPRQIRDLTRAVALAFRSIAGSLRRNYLLALTSLILSTLLWAAVTRSQNPVVTASPQFAVPVTEQNLNGQLITDGLSPDHVQIRVAGPRDAVLRLKSDDVKANVDLTGLGVGTYELPVRVTVRESTIRIEQVIPSRVKVVLEKLERKDHVPVHIKFLGNNPYYQADATLSVNEVTVYGRAANVQAVEQAVATIDLSLVTGNASESVPLTAADALGNSILVQAIKPDRVTVDIKVRQVIGSRLVPVVASLRGRPAPGYVVTDVQVEPATVNVVAGLEVLNGITSLTTDQVDVDGATSDVVRSVTVHVPPGASIGSQRTVIVTAKIVPQVGEGYLPATLKAANVGTGFSAQFGVRVYLAPAIGPLPQFTTVKPSDVVATVDCTGLGPGSYELVPKVTVPTGFTVDTAQLGKVPVTIVAR